MKIYMFCTHVVEAMNDFREYTFQMDSDANPRDSASFRLHLAWEASERFVTGERYLITIKGVPA